MNDILSKWLNGDQVKALLAPLPAGVDRSTGEPCECECHRPGVVVMHCFPCCVPKQETPR